MLFIIVKTLVLSLTAAGVCGKDKIMQLSSSSVSVLLCWDVRLAWESLSLWNTPESRGHFCIPCQQPGEFKRHWCRFRQMKVYEPGDPDNWLVKFTSPDAQKIPKNSD